MIQSSEAAVKQEINSLKHRMDELFLKLETKQSMKE